MLEQKKVIEYAKYLATFSISFVVISLLGMVEIITLGADWTLSKFVIVLLSLVIIAISFSSTEPTHSTEKP
jgi:hypothetical protein